MSFPFWHAMQVMIVLRGKVRNIRCYGKRGNIKCRILLCICLFRQRSHGNGIFFPTSRLTGPECRNTDPSNTTFTGFIILSDPPDEKSPPTRVRLKNHCILYAINPGQNLSAASTSPRPIPPDNPYNPGAAPHQTTYPSSAQELFRRRSTLKSHKRRLHRIDFSHRGA